MDKDILIQICSIKREVADAEKRIRKLTEEKEKLMPESRDVADVVNKGKRGKKPLGTVLIKGGEDYSKINKKIAEIDKNIALKEQYKGRLKALVAEGEIYIYGLKDSEIRRLLMFYCIDGLTWEQVAEAMGTGYTAETCRQKFSRFIREKQAVK